MESTQEGKQVLREENIRNKSHLSQIPHPNACTGAETETSWMAYPDRSAIESSARSQSQSAFFASLPLEVRAQIYIELWQIAGLSQHIFLRGKHHHDSRKSPFTHWRCITPFNVLDDRQAEIQKVRDQINTPLGTDCLFHNPVWYRRLESSWYNH